MTIATLSQYLSRLEATSSRLEITELLRELLQKTSKDEVAVTCYLVLGQLAPVYEGVVFNVAGNFMLRAIAQAYNKDIADVKAAYKKAGDVGTVAQEYAKGAKRSIKRDMSVDEVYHDLAKLAQEEGEGSQERRIHGLSLLLAKMDPTSARYVARIPMGNLRLGFSEKTLLDALATLEGADPHMKTRVLQAYEVLPDIGLLAQKIKTHGVSIATKNIEPVVGVPVMPMLAQRIKSPAEMIKKMGKVSIEPKFDGVRVLIHLDKKRGIIKAYTRNLRDVSAMFPELAALGQHLRANDVILDTEAVGIDPEMETLLDFQTTMQRRRKHDIAATSTKIPLQFQAFDILVKDGKDLMHAPYTTRRDVLDATVAKNSLLLVDQYTLTQDPGVITKKHEEFRANGLEGIIVKKADSQYVPGRTGWRWVKMKEAEDSVAKLSDTIDGVIMGYTAGKGKRAAFGIGQFLVGIKDGDDIRTLTKVGTGISDEALEELGKTLKKLVTPTMPKEYAVAKLLTPDYWVEPSIVVELAGDDLTKSPQHTSGYALRFPRLVKVRHDKGVSEITTKKEVTRLFGAQKK